MDMEKKQKDEEGPQTHKKEKRLWGAFVSLFAKQTGIQAFRQTPGPGR
jgi:hypothetical protein